MILSIYWLSPGSLNCERNSLSASSISIPRKSILLQKALKTATLKLSLCPIYYPIANLLKPGVVNKNSLIVSGSYSKS